MFVQTSCFRESAERFLTGCRLPKRWIIGGVAFFLIGLSALDAQEVWHGPRGTSSSWFNPANWSPMSLPTSDTNAIVVNGGTADIGLGQAFAANLRIDSNSTIDISAGSLTVSNPVLVGTEGRLLFSGGTLTATGANPRIQDNGIVEFSGTGNQNLSHTLTGIGGLTVDLDGTLFVFSSNNYGGRTLIVAGKLQAKSVTALSPFSAFTVNSGATLDLNGFNNRIGSLSGAGTVSNSNSTRAALTVGNGNTKTTFSGVLEDGAGVLQLIKSGTGTLTLTGNNIYTGGTTISAGTLQLGNDGTSGSIAGNVTDNGTLAFNRSDPVAFAGVISGAGNVVKLGPNTLTLTEDNTYTGSTTISAGTLQLGNGGTAGSIVGNVTDNGTLAFDRSNPVTFDGVISGAGNVVKLGPNTLTLTGINTYTGGTTVSAGTLQAGALNGFSPNSAFTVNSILDLNGFNNTIGSLSGTGTGIVLNNGPTIATLTVGNDNTTTTFGGVLENGTGGLQLVKSGTGTLTLTGDNTIEGATINGGTLQLGNGGTTGSFAGDIANNGTLSFNRSDTLTFGGEISGAGNVTQIGTGTTILTGTNTYTGGTTINAGTLQLGNGGMTGSITGNVANNGTLTFDRSGTLTFPGNISSVGSVFQIGNGTTILTGNNTYTGGTTISAGTLQAGSTTGFSSSSEFTVNSILDLHGFNSAIGSLSGNGTVLNNSATPAALTVGNDNASTSFAGVLANGTGILQLIKSGMGRLTLTGTSTYTGGTTISAGTLQLGNGGTTGSIAGDVANNGTLAFDRSDSVTFGGVISGPGNVVNLGSGTLILAGTNIYTGGTLISAGTLQVGNGRTTGSIVGNVLDNGTLAFNRSDSVTFTGVISGPGNVVKLGTGTLTLPGANTYTGITTVNNGSLIVDGSIASAQTVVNPGGSLGGHGTIGGSLVNSGIIAQNNSPGTLTIANDFNQNAGGTLRIGVAGIAPGQHDLLVVNGHAAVAGTLQFISLGGFNLQPGDQITFLTAKNGVSGTFNNTQNGLVSTGTIVQAQVTSLPDSIVLEGTQGSFADTPGVATTPNAKAVANALDSAEGDPRAAALFAFLNSQPLADLPHDLALIAPTQITAINATAVSVAKVQIANIAMRLANVQAGSTGFSSAGLSINGGAASFGEGFAGVSGPEGKGGAAVFAPTPDNRWGVFLTGLGEFSNVDSTPNALGYDVNTGGFTMGVDYRLTPNFALGLTAGYAHTSVGLDGGGNIDVNGGKLGVYATLFGNGLYLDTAVTGGPSGYHTRRTALQGTASGSTNGADFNVLVATGYDWKHGNLSIGPTATFQYSYVGLRAFTETGSLAPLTFPNQNTQSELTAFGGKATYEWKIGQITVLPQISAAWQHEYGTTAYSVIASFANGAGNSFSVEGPQIGRDSILVGAGGSVILSERVSTYLYYDGEFARTNYLSNNVSGGVRLSF